MTQLAKLRMVKNLSQSQLSELSRVPLSTVQKLDAGINDIQKAQVDTVKKLAYALGVSIEEIIRRGNDE